MEHGDRYPTRTKSVLFTPPRLAGILLALVAIPAVSELQAEHAVNISGARQSVSDSTSLKLADCPSLFNEDVLIVLGERTSDLESKTAAFLSQKLGALFASPPAVKTIDELSSEDWAQYNVVLAGTPNSLNIPQAIRDESGEPEVTPQYPGDGKSVLEIGRNPWNREKALVVITGSDERGEVNGVAAFYYLMRDYVEYRHSDAQETALKGVVEHQFTSWCPQFDDCTTACYFIEVSGRKYFLSGLCHLLFLSPGNDYSESCVLAGEIGQPYLGQEVEIRGKFEKREPANSLAGVHESQAGAPVYDVILVRELELVREGDQKGGGHEHQ
jgi:hypothetical protein